MVLKEEEKRDKLIQKKNDIIEKFLFNMRDLNNNITKRIDHAMRNNARDINANLSFYNKLKAVFKLTTSDTIKIKNEDGLQFADKWFKTEWKKFKIIMDTAKEDYKSLLSNIDDSIASTNKEIELLKDAVSTIDEQVHKTRDKGKLKWLEREKGKIVRGKPISRIYRR